MLAMSMCLRWHSPDDATNMINHRYDACFFEYSPVYKKHKKMQDEERRDDVHQPTNDEGKDEGQNGTQDEGQDGPRVYTTPSGKYYVIDHSDGTRVCYPEWLIANSGRMDNLLTASKYLNQRVSEIMTRKRN